MDEERKAWYQKDGEKTLWHETTKALAVFNEYCLLGPSRSLAKLAKKDGKSTAYVRQLERWSSTFHWQERARAYDEHIRAEEDRILAAEKEKVLRSGFALMHERVEALDKLTRKLISYAHDEKNVWLPDVKSVQVGKFDYERVDIVHFNAPLFTLIDKYFASIAAELGERVKKQEVTGKDGGPLEIDVLVETHWGRGTDPRKQSEDDAPQEIQPDEDESEISVEFGEAGE